MADAKTEAPAAPAVEKQVLIFHTGEGYGPMETAGGRLIPGQSLSVPEKLAKTLVSAYRHVKYAADIIPGAQAAEMLSSEKAALLAQISALEGKITGIVADSEAKVADLSARLKDFLEAGSKKDLDALKEKHADAVPAEVVA